MCVSHAIKGKRASVPHLELGSLQRDSCAPLSVWGTQRTCVSLLPTNSNGWETCWLTVLTVRHRLGCYVEQPLPQRNCLSSTCSSIYDKPNLAMCEGDPAYILYWSCPRGSKETWNENKADPIWEKLEAEPASSRLGKWGIELDSSCSEAQEDRRWELPQAHAELMRVTCLWRAESAVLRDSGK